jgi:hypothetical protein
MKIFTTLSLITIFSEKIFAQNVCSTLSPCDIYYNETAEGAITINKVKITNATPQYKLPSVCDPDWNWEKGVDWSNKTLNPCGINIVSPVVSQGSCGSCYAFSSAGAIESQYALRNLLTFDDVVTPPAVGLAPTISQQQILDCTYNIVPNGRSFLNKACSGGNPKITFDWAINTEFNFCTTNSYPYTGRKGTCQSVCTHVTAIDAQNDLEPSEDGLIQGLRTGPVAVSIQANKPIFTNSVSVYSSNPNDCGLKGGHSVLLVGFEANPFNATRVYWKIKNSWGQNDGALGYWYLLRNPGFVQGQCGIAQNPSQPLIAS